MDANVIKRNELLAQKTIEGLKSRNMEGYYAASREEALKIALDMIPEGSSISMGGGMSVHEIGLSDALKNGNYNFIDRDEYEDKRKAMLLAYDADYYLASCNAMTDDGVLVNIDGNSNRVSAIAQGPKHVIFIVGMNKICNDVDSAMKRARNVAAPINVQRFGLNTPCSKKGTCFNCKSPDTICCQILITRFSRHPGRISVILVNDNLGF
ncbi:MAG: lactate utilization protein [Lachnospiraceae bacterium]|nr:lactate utilization protein [Lachnospiraceae bacterium]